MLVVNVHWMIDIRAAWTTSNDVLPMVHQVFSERAQITRQAIRASMPEIHQLEVRDSVRVVCPSELVGAVLRHYESISRNWTVHVWKFDENGVAAIAASPDRSDWPEPVITGVLEATLEVSEGLYV